MNRLRRRKGGKDYDKKYWLSNYQSKRVRNKDYALSEQLLGKYNRDGYITNVMKYVNERTMLLATSAITIDNDGRIGYDVDKAVGLDGISRSTFNKEAHHNIKELIEQLRNGQYKVGVTRRVYIPKGHNSKKLRPLTIMNYKDQLVQKTIVNQILEDILEEELSECIHSYRTNRSVDTAIQNIRRVCKQHTINYALKIDIEGYYDNIPIEILLNELKKIIKDKVCLGIIRKILYADCWISKEEATKKAKLEDKNIDNIPREGVTIKTTKGIQQGSVIGPYLANFFMDRVIAKWLGKEVHPIIYGDDVIVLTETITQAERLKKDICDRLMKFKLTMSKEKSSITDLRKETIEFLGREIRIIDRDVDILISDSKIEENKRKIKELIVRASMDNIKERTNTAIYGNIYEWKYYYQDYIWWLNDSLNGIYRTYRKCLNRYKLEELYVYACETVSLQWTNSGRVDKETIKYLTNHILSPLDKEIMYLKNRK